MVVSGVVDVIFYVFTDLCALPVPPTVRVLMEGCKIIKGSHCEGFELRSDP